jgi:hypothetical protein
MTLFNILLFGFFLFVLYICLRNAAGSRREPTREEAINQACTRWKNRGVHLGRDGKINACLGNGRYVWVDGDNVPHIICGGAARRMVFKVYPQEKRDRMSSAGMVSGLSDYDCAMMELSTMNWYGSMRYEVGSRGGFQAVPANVFAPSLRCELPCCNKSE